eukprot:COSAG02_NODE_947_length_15716_cov_7.567971_21_plen_82_part_00
MQLSPVLRPTRSNIRSYYYEYIVRLIRLIKTLDHGSEFESTYSNGRTYVTSPARERPRVRGAGVRLTVEPRPCTLLAATGD